MAPTKKKPASKKPASKKPASKKAASKKPAPKKAAKKAAPKKSAPKKSAPKKSAPKKAAPKTSARQAMPTVVDAEAAEVTEVTEVAEAPEVAAAPPGKSPNEALWDACRREGDQADAAAAAIADGADPNVPDPYGRPALHLALMFDKLKVAKAILDSGAEIDVNARDTQDRECNPALIHAARAGAGTDIVAAILERGADVNAVDGGYDQATALHHAIRARQPDLEVIELLIERTDGALDVRDATGCTPLHAACKSHSGELSETEAAIALRLIERGADVTAVDQNRSTPLHLAARSGGLTVIEALLARGADVNARDDNGEPPLAYAFGTRDKRKDIWNRLAAAGHELDAKLLEVAATNSNSTAVEWLKSRGV
jgi:ankyrin repeat protein